VSAAAGGIDVAQAGGPSLRLRVCAVAVVLALAGLAAFAVFAGPTTVPLKAPSASHTRAAPPVRGRGTETERGDRHD
jgi:hypothetical protein